MYISDFRRTDTVSYPGFLLSAVEVSDGSGEGVSEVEVSNTIYNDRVSLDGVLFRGSGKDILEFDGIHRLIKNVMPKHIISVVETNGKRTDTLDDLIGAGYINDAIIVLDMFPVKTQQESLEILRKGDCRFGVKLYLDPERLTLEDAHKLIHSMSGALQVQLRRPDAEGDRKRYRKNDLMALAKPIRAVARDVKIY